MSTLLEVGSPNFIHFIPYIEGFRPTYISLARRDELLRGSISRFSSLCSYILHILLVDLTICIRSLLNVKNGEVQVISSLVINFI